MKYGAKSTSYLSTMYAQYIVKDKGKAYVKRCTPLWVTGPGTSTDSLDGENITCASPWKLYHCQAFSIHFMHRTSNFAGFSWAYSLLVSSKFLAAHDGPTPNMLWGCRWGHESTRLITSHGISLHFTIPYLRYPAQYTSYFPFTSWYQWHQSESEM